MHSTVEDQRARVLQRLQEYLNRAEAQQIALRRRNQRLISSSLAASTMATVVAGATSAFGPPLGEGIPAWRFWCTIAAILAALATLASGMQQRMSVPERLARANECVGKLHALELGLTVTGRDPASIGKEMEELVASYRDIVTA